MKQDRRKYLYENGIIAKGKTVVKTNIFMTIIDAVFCISPIQRPTFYNFIAENGKQYSGQDEVVLFDLPKIYFAGDGVDVNIIYDPNNPSYNEVYAERYNKKYKK